MNDKLKSYTIDLYTGQAFTHRTAYSATNPFGAFREAGYQVKQFKNIKLSNRRLTGEFAHSNKTLVIEVIS